MKSMTCSDELERDNDGEAVFTSYDYYENNYNWPEYNYDYLNADFRYDEDDVEYEE